MMVRGQSRLISRIKIERRYETVIVYKYPLKSSLVVRGENHVAV